MKEQKEPLFEFILTTKYNNRTLSVFHQYGNSNGYEMGENLILLIHRLMITEGYSKEEVKKELTFAIESYIES